MGLNLRGAADNAVTTAANLLLDSTDKVLALVGRGRAFVDEALGSALLHGIDGVDRALDGIDAALPRVEVLVKAAVEAAISPIEAAQSWRYIVPEGLLDEEDPTQH